MEMFKFQIFDRFSLGNLRENVIYCNKFDAFNDPFECWCIENNGFPDPEKERARFLEIIRIWGFTSDRAAEAANHYRAYIQDLGDSPGFVDALKQTARIACFSSEAENLLMWAHYADGMRGFCIELDEVALLEANEKTNPKFFDVQYRTAPPFVESVAYSIANDMWWHSEDITEGIAAIDDLIGKVLATKPFQWAYESEQRVICFGETDTTGGIKLAYAPSMIKSVAIGERASQRDTDELMAILVSIGWTHPIQIAKRDPSHFVVQTA